VIGIDPKYFLDEMSSDEVVALYKAKDENNKEEWEKVRTICYYNYIAMQGNRVIKKPSDLFQFSWEKRTAKGDKLTEEAAKVKASKMHKKHGK